MILFRENNNFDADDDKFVWIRSRKLSSIPDISGSCPKSVGDGYWERHIERSGFLAEAGWEVTCMECCKDTVNLGINGDSYEYTIETQRSINGKPVYKREALDIADKTTFLVYHKNNKRWIVVSQNTEPSDDSVNALSIET